MEVGPPLSAGRSRQQITIALHRSRAVVVCHWAVMEKAQQDCVRWIVRRRTQVNHAMRRRKPKMMSKAGFVFILLSVRELLGRTDTYDYRTSNLILTRLAINNGLVGIGADTQTLA